MKNKVYTERSRSGFTLIELLVVIFIIALLASIVIVNVNSARLKARDARRMADLSTVRTTLELYNDMNKSYPSTVGLSGFGNPLHPIIMSTDPIDWVPGLTPQFISVLPKDPKNQEPYRYWYQSDGTDYKLFAQAMESQEGFNRAANDGGSHNCPYADKTNECAYELFSSGAQGW